MSKTRSDTNAGSGVWRLAIVSAAILLPLLVTSCGKKGQEGEKKTVQKSEDDFLDKDAKPDERKYLLAAKPFFIAVASGRYADAYALFSSHARARMFLNQFTPAQQLGTTTSWRRFKEGIKPVDKASEALFSLTPVTFHYKEELDPAAVEQFGLIAEDVEKVNPDLVVRDKEGKPYSVRYDQVNAMLLNEFLKEHRKVEKLEATVAALAAQLDKVAAQVQIKQPAMRVAVENQ